MDEIVVQLLRRVVLMGEFLRQLSIVRWLVLDRLQDYLLLNALDYAHLLRNFLKIIVRLLGMLFVLLLLTDLVEFRLGNRFGGSFIRFKGRYFNLFILRDFLLNRRGEPKGLLPFLNGLCLSYRLILSFNLRFLKNWDFFYFLIDSLIFFFHSIFKFFLYRFFIFFLNNTQSSNFLLTFWRNVLILYFLLILPLSLQNIYLFHSNIFGCSSCFGGWLGWDFFLDSLF